MATRAPVYTETLRVPVRWWVLGAGFVGSLAVAYGAATGPVGGLTAAAVSAVMTGTLLVGYGRVRLVVATEGFHAGPALLPGWAIGGVEVLDAEAARQLRGPQADARAYLVLRGYVPQAVRVHVDDPADPAPYWLVSTRHPQRLAAALQGCRR